MRRKHSKAPAKGWTGPASWMKREARAGDRLPYEAHVRDDTVRLRDGSLLRAIYVPGLTFETEEADTLNHHQSVREVLFRSALDSRFVIYHHVIRRAVEVELPGHFEQPFAKALNDRWQHHLAERRLFSNEQFITVVRRAPRGKLGWIEKLSRQAAPVSASGPEDQRALDAVVTSLLAGLQAHGARSLGCYPSGGAKGSEILELLSALYNGELRPVLAPRQIDLGDHLPYSRVSFGLDAIEIRSPKTRSFGGILSLKEYPPSTHAGIMDAVLRAPHELVLTETFAPVERQIARERIDLALRRLKATDDDGVTERTEMRAAKDWLSAGAVGFGDHHLSLLVRSSDLRSLDQALADVATSLADIGAVAVREDVNLEPAFWAQFPGNESYIVRRSLISTANAASFISLHGFPMGQAGGNHWGPATTVLETTSSSPYFFNFHEGDLGHFSVIGPSGSGKTVVMNFLAAQAQKHGPRLVFFDKDRGAEIFIRALGGHYARLTPGERTGFNPLALKDSPTTRAFLREWLGCLLEAKTAEERATIAAAVDACYENDAAFRRLRYFRELLCGGSRPREDDLAARLAPWINNGEHAWLFDNARDELNLECPTLGFDMTALLDDPRLRTPAMMYLFFRIDARLDGHPTVILIDEGWKALDDQIFVARIRDWLKTLRKRNAIVGFGTQSASDALTSRISSALVEQTATMIFMPNPKAQEEDYCGGFRLTRHELELIRSLPAHSRCFLVRHANHSVVVRLDLSSMPDILLVLSGREATVRQLDQLRTALGDEPERWYEALTGSRWPGFEDAPYVLEAAE